MEMGSHIGKEEKGMMHAHCGYEQRKRMIQGRRAGGGKVKKSVVITAKEETKSREKGPKRKRKKGGGRTRRGTDTRGFGGKKGENPKSPS